MIRTHGVVDTRRKVLWQFAFKSKPRLVLPSLREAGLSDEDIKIFDGET